LQIKEHADVCKFARFSAQDWLFFLGVPTYDHNRLVILELRIIFLYMTTKQEGIPSWNFEEFLNTRYKIISAIGPHYPKSSDILHCLPGNFPKTSHSIKPPPYSAKSSILQAPKTTKRKAESNSYEETSPIQVDSDGEAFTNNEHPDFGGE